MKPRKKAEPRVWANEGKPWSIHDDQWVVAYGPCCVTDLERSGEAIEERVKVLLENGAWGALERHGEVERQSWKNECTALYEYYKCFGHPDPAAALQKDFDEHGEMPLSLKG